MYLVDFFIALFKETKICQKIANAIQEIEWNELYI